MTDIPQHYTAEQTSHPQAADHGWAIYYDATPGGKKNEDGSTSFSLRFPALLLSDYVANPEAVAREIAAELNRSTAQDAANPAA